MTAKKKKIAPLVEPFPRIEGDFEIVGCDLSMYCSGFCVLAYHADRRCVELVRKSICSNRSNRSRKKDHGDILTDIVSMFADYIGRAEVKVIVREKVFSKFAMDTQALSKVAGATEMILWGIHHIPFQELAPLSIKKAVTGYGKASKEEVAEAIDNYCSHSDFQSDDESDAVAVAIAWLIENGYLDCIPLEKYEENFKKCKAQ